MGNDKRANTYKSYDSMKMTPDGKSKMVEAADDCESSDYCSSKDEPMERGSFKTGGFFGYPPYMILLLLMELCERFAFYGIRSVLAIFFTRQLGYTQSQGTMIYHGYIVACYTTPILGGIIADQYWGKYKTILVLSIVYALGNGVISIASAMTEKTMGQQIFTFAGLGLVALGTGGIKPCVSAFCGDQLDPNDKPKREQFFTVFYMCINIGAMISSYMTPTLRQDPCMGKDTCYPLAFGVPSVLMFVSLILFIMGTKLYIKNKSRSNVFTQCVKTIAGVNPKATREFKLDSKRVVKIFKIIAPIFFFWAIFDQAGSVFTYQAGQLDKSIYSNLARRILFMPEGWLQEDQIEAMNPIILLTLIPIFNVIIYPAVSTIWKLTALRKMSIGLFVNVIVCLFGWWFQKRIDKNFTYVYPEYNKKSSIASATFVFQVQYQKDGPDTTYMSDRAYTHLGFENMDAYDWDAFDGDAKNGNGVANELIRENGQYSPRFWTWFNNTDRQHESIVDADNYNSRLVDKLGCSKSWAKDLPHIKYTGHSDLKVKDTEWSTHDDYRGAYFGKPQGSKFRGNEKFLFPAGKYTKVLIYPNGQLFLVDVPVLRPKQGRSYLNFYTQQKNVSSKEYFWDKFYCQNTKNYEFKRVEDYTPCLERKGKDDVQTGPEYSKHQCESDGGKVGDTISKYYNLTMKNDKGEKGDLPIKYDKKNGENDLYLPEAIYTPVPTWPLSMRTRLNNRSIVDDSKLYRTTFMIPLGSECWLKDGSKADSATFTEETAINIGANAVYSMVDYTLPGEIKNSTENTTKWQETPTVDMTPLTEPVIWQFLLYLLCTSAEILISISGLEYSYAQAPQSMKSMVSSLWLLPVCMGNIYVMWLSSFYYFKTHAYKVHRFNAFLGTLVAIGYIFLSKAYVTSEDEAKAEEKRKLNVKSTPSKLPEKLM